MGNEEILKAAFTLVDKQKEAAFTTSSCFTYKALCFYFNAYVW